MCCAVSTVLKLDKVHIALYELNNLSFLFLVASR